MPAKPKLSINACSLDKAGKITVKKGSRFRIEVMLNPSSYSHSQVIRYDHKDTLGQIATEPRFAAVGAEKVDFELVLDGTGVVDWPGRNAGTGRVKEQVKWLNSIVYEYDGNSHQPNVVRLLWGSFIFFGRLSAMSTKYTLFEPEGNPLRARVTLSFIGFMSKSEERLQANRSSPDLTHRVVVKAGDTLPLLCHQIYQDGSYYMDVARHNGLTDVRRLTPGTILHFPPLRTD